MIVEQPEAFKSWLTAVLKPMCEADPAALAKYVIALIKKDKTDDELRKSMVSQLEVFLEGETQSFVNLVFQTLQTHDYIFTPVIPNTNPPNPNLVKKESKERLTTTAEKSSENEAVYPNVSSSSTGRKDIDLKKDRENKKGESEKEDKGKDDKMKTRLRHQSISKNRSRSRSWDRSKRSRSREKSREREYRIDREKRDRMRPWRIKSPRRYERRRSRTPPPSPTRLRSRSRSPRYQHRSRYRNRSPLRSITRSRSKSPEKLRKEPVKEKDILKDHLQQGAPMQGLIHGDLDLRLPNATQTVQSSIVAVSSTKRRCRDFDEKGFCMRGEMCPFDHGIDPVVLEDSALTSVIYNSNGATTTEVPVNIPPPVITTSGHSMIGPRMMVGEYNPQAPQIFRGFRGPRPFIPPRMPQMGMFQSQVNINRELIAVPVIDNKTTHFGQDFQSNFLSKSKQLMDGQDNVFMKKKVFDYNRLGVRTKHFHNCSLELKKVPAELNTISHINNHFSKFGRIINIQVNYEGDSEATMVTFSSHSEANNAYRSTEAVLNNRFIKVFWHHNGTDPRPIKDRLGDRPPNSSKVLSEVITFDNATAEIKADIDKASISKEETKIQQSEAIRKNQELLAAKEKYNKSLDEQRKEVLKIRQNLKRRKQELLEKQLTQQKILIEKMEKLPAGSQRDLIKETIVKSQQSIENIQKDITKTSLSSRLEAIKKSAEDAQKHLLDVELDLITKQQEGADTTELQKKISELRAKTVLLRGRAKGVRFHSSRRHLLTKNNLINVVGGTISNKMYSNVAVSSSTKLAVDHRPTMLLVSGYEADEQEAVLIHFKQFGEIIDYETDVTLPSVILNYKVRKDAEIALFKGKHFQDRTLSVTWATAMKLNKQPSVSPEKKLAASDTEEENLLDNSNYLDIDDDIAIELSEDVLLQDDEDDDDESESRSWRR